MVCTAERTEVPEEAGMSPPEDAPPEGAATALVIAGMLMLPTELEPTTELKLGGAATALVTAETLELALEVVT